MTTHDEGAEDPRQLGTIELDEIPLERCPIGCGHWKRGELPSGWEAKEGEPVRAIPIIGCGNPWHYLERDGGLLRPLSTPATSTPEIPEGWIRVGSTVWAPPPTVELAELEPRRVTLSLRHPDASVSAVQIEWPADVRLPVAGDALRIPDVGTVIVNGATFDLAAALDGAPAELREIQLGCYVIAGT
jgi:hypothetical protein